MLCIMVGTDTRNPLAGRRVTVNAQMAAVELSMTGDWLRPIVSFTYASGDRDPTSGKPKGLIAFSINRTLLGEILAFGIGKGYAYSA